MRIDTAPVQPRAHGLERLIPAAKLLTKKRSASNCRGTLKTTLRNRIIYYNL
jgi:hypothetical protein